MSVYEEENIDTITSTKALVIRFKFCNYLVLCAFHKLVTMFVIFIRRYLILYLFVGRALNFLWKFHSKI
jgi:hypothetical protein